MANVLSTLWHQRSSRHLSLAIILLFTMGLGLAPWYAAFMIRSHGMGTAELGVWLALIFGLWRRSRYLVGGLRGRRWFSTTNGSIEHKCGDDRLTGCRASSISMLPQKHGALIALGRWRWR